MLNTTSPLSLPIFQALQSSCQELNIEPQRAVVVVSQPMTEPLIAANLVVVPPAQALQVATGIAIANPALRVFVASNAETQYRGGISALLETAAQNQNIKLIVRNASFDNNGTDPLAIALTGGLSFAGRGFVGNQQHLQSLISTATKHDGFSIIDVVEPGSESTKTFAWYRQNLQEISPTANKEVACQALQQKRDKIVVGVIYQKRQPSFQTQLLKRIPSPRVDQPLKNINIKLLLKDLK
jgi:2-oxoglutarate ferredoxin oxidoreductase subunit beta